MTHDAYTNPIHAVNTITEKLNQVIDVLNDVSFKLAYLENIKTDAVTNHKVSPNIKIIKGGGV